LRGEEEWGEGKNGKKISNCEICKKEKKLEKTKGVEGGNRRRKGLEKTAESPRMKKGEKKRQATGTVSIKGQVVHDSE